MKKKIMVLQRGWVVVGDVAENDGQVVIENAAVIRRWGTTKGLGELAANGPLKNTILDPCGTVRVHPLGVVFSLDTDGDKWKP